MPDEPATNHDAATAPAAAAEVGLRRSRDAVVKDDPGRARRQSFTQRSLTIFGIFVTVKRNYKEATLLSDRGCYRKRYGLEG